MSRLPFLRTWLRTRNAIILHLSNGTIQVLMHNLNFIILLILISNLLID